MRDKWFSFSSCIRYILGSATSKIVLLALLAFPIIYFSDGFAEHSTEQFSEDDERVSLLPGRNHHIHSREPIIPIPHQPPLNEKKVALGDLLFHDARFSADNTVSCSTCHNLATGGDDGLPVSPGVGGVKGQRNSPTVFNAALNLTQFWDGRAATLEEQIEGPIHNPSEMRTSWEEIIAKLLADQEIVKKFNDIYGANPTAETITDAIATFERSLITYDAPFDQYLKGDSTAITPKAKEGYDLFKDLGCSSCHQGVNVGGNMFQKLGVVLDYEAEIEEETPDYGRKLVTGRKEDRFVFKVPSLRNVAKTAPYFHDGSVSTLDAAIAIMARFQLGKIIAEDESVALAEFLTSLNGKLPEGME